MFPPSRITIPAQRLPVKGAGTAENAATPSGRTDKERAVKDVYVQFEGRLILFHVG